MGEDLSVLLVCLVLAPLVFPIFGNVPPFRRKRERHCERVELNAGEMFVVPKGVEHKPFASAECKSSPARALERATGRAATGSCNHSVKRSPQRRLSVSGRSIREAFLLLHPTAKIIVVNTSSCGGVIETNGDRHEERIRLET